jgi:hypothetical protein
VLGLGTVPVEHSGDLAGAPSAPRATLAELGTADCGQTDLGHDELLLAL